MKSEKLKILEEEVKNCKRCNLWKERKNPVFGGGNPDANILFIGEAPGYYEDLKGIPFCGKAGKILDILFDSVGIKRSDVYITNIIKCRPPGNRDPKIEEIEACRYFIEKQIEIIKPEVICCLGRHSLKFIFNKFSIKEEANMRKVHGKVFEKNTLFSPVKIVALYHPAFATYNPKALEILKKDFEILKKI